MRVLPIGPDHVRGGAAAVELCPLRCRHRCRHGGEPLPLRYLCQNSQGDSSRRRNAAGGHAVMSEHSSGLQSENPDRREFFKRAAAAGGGLVLALTLPAFGGRASRAASGQASGGAARDSQLNAWLKIGSDNSVTFLVDRSEMGQGVYTALPMLLAEELEIDLARIKIVAAPVGDAYVNALNGGQITGTSNSVSDAWVKLRTAGAQARTMLISAAAQAWGISPAECHAEKGTIVSSRGKSLTYGELAGAAAKIPVPKEVRLKGPADFKVIGQSLARLD